MQEDLFTLENLYQAYTACRRHKRGTMNALRFEIRLLDELCDLKDRLVDRSYHPGTSICFIQRRPKMREIFAADFRDRVVHHLLVGYLEPIFERKFIHDSYACRREKGVHTAVARLGSFLNGVTRNGTKRAWYLKQDISGFFMNIDKEILYGLICRHIKREEVRWLARVIIFHECTMDYRFKGNQLLLNRIPPHKTLFGVGPGKGLPIGNLTSQFFANVYLNELDQFIKRELGCRHYMRYCDDFVLLHESPEVLQKWHEAIEDFVTEKLLLSLNDKQHRLQPVANGIDFLGYIVRRRYVLARRRVVNHFRERLDELEKQLAERKWGHIVAWRYPPRVMAVFRSTVASYLGHLQWADTRGLVTSLFKRHPVLKAAFVLRQGHIVPRYLPAKGARGLRATYKSWVPPAPRPVDPPGLEVIRPLWVRNGEYPRVLVFFPVGRFYEFYDTQALAATEVLNLKLLSGLRWFRYGCGFHKRFFRRYLHTATTYGYHVALIRAEKHVDGTVHRRLVRLFRARAHQGVRLPSLPFR